MFHIKAIPGWGVQTGQMVQVGTCTHGCDDVLDMDEVVELIARLLAWLEEAHGVTPEQVAACPVVPLWFDDSENS